MRFIFLFSLIALSYGSFSQALVRQFKGIKGVGVVSHFTAEGYGFGVMGSYGLNRSFSLEEHLFYDAAGFAYTDSKQFLSQTDLLYNICTFKRDFFVFGSAGVLMGKEKLSSTVEDKKEEGFVIYGNAAVQLRYYYNNYGFFCSLQENIGNGNLGRYYFQANIGALLLLTNFTKKNTRKINSPANN